MSSGSLRDEQAAVISRCMPWPLAAFCRLDNLSGKHETEAGPLCRAHDFVMVRWCLMFPRSEAKFMRKLLAELNP